VQGHISEIRCGVISRWGYFAGLSKLPSATECESMGFWTDIEIFVTGPAVSDCRPSHELVLCDWSCSFGRQWDANLRCLRTQLKKFSHVIEDVKSLSKTLRSRILFSK